MGNGYYADSAYVVHPNGHDYDAIGTSHGHSDVSVSSSGTTASSQESKGTMTGEGNQPSEQPGLTIVPPPYGDCRRKQVDSHTFVERVCGPERRREDEIRIIEYIPPVQP